MKNNKNCVSNKKNEKAGVKEKVNVFWFKVLDQKVAMKDDQEWFFHCVEMLSWIRNEYVHIHDLEFFYERKCV